MMTDSEWIPVSNITEPNAYFAELYFKYPPKLSPENQYSEKRLQGDKSYY